MANCSICGKSCGLMGGGKEPYTGHDLIVCNNCGAFFKKLDQSIASLDRKEFEKYKQDLLHISKETPQEYKIIIEKYLQEANEKFSQKEITEINNAPTKTEPTDQICPICKHLIYQGNSVCDFCGYSIEEYHLTPEQRKEINLRKNEQLLKNAFYEYKVEIISDSEILGKTSKADLESTITNYALDGWRLHSITTNEIGKNAMLGVNATINNTILIFERCIKATD